jgi:hypothetical protein
MQQCRVNNPSFRTKIRTTDRESYVSKLVKIDCSSRCCRPRRHFPNLDRIIQGYGLLESSRRLPTDSPFPKTKKPGNLFLWIASVSQGDGMLDTTAVYRHATRQLLLWITIVKVMDFSSRRYRPTRHFFKTKISGNYFFGSHQ